MGMAGNTYIYNYENGLEFRTDFSDATRVKWECIGGSEKGNKGEGPVQIIDLGSERSFLHWIESDGLAVTQTVDLKRGRVATSLVFPKGFDGKGKVASVLIQGTVRKLSG